MISNLLTATARSFGLSTLMPMAVLATRLLPIPKPTLMVGPGSSARLGHAICAFDHQCVLVVTDPVVSKLDLKFQLVHVLKAGSTAYVEFNQMQPGTPVALIEKGVVLFNKHECDAVVAILVGARPWMPQTTNPRRNWQGISRASDPDTHRKLVIAGTRIVPRMAALEPTLMVDLPPCLKKIYRRWPMLPAARRMSITPCRCTCRKRCVRG